MKKIGFIGFGNMAQAIISGLINSGNFIADEIGVFDTDVEKMKIAADVMGIKVFNSNSELVESCKCIVLAVKPNALQGLLDAIGVNLCKANTLVISIAAGQSIQKLQNYMGYKAKIVRVMPNINALAGQAIAGFTYSENVSNEELDFSKKVLSSFGEFVEVRESDFSAFSAIAGCSPAYSYLFADALARVGVKFGISKKEALDIVVETIITSIKDDFIKQSAELDKVILNAINAAHKKIRN